MKLVTPLDYWRAGFDLWLAGWKTQIELTDQLVARLTAYQAGILTPATAQVPAVSAKPRAVLRGRRPS